MLLAPSLPPPAAKLLLIRTRPDSSVERASDFSPDAQGLVICVEHKKLKCTVAEGRQSYRNIERGSVISTVPAPIGLSCHGLTPQPLRLKEASKETTSYEFIAHLLLWNEVFVDHQIPTLDIYDYLPHDTFGSGHSVSCTPIKMLLMTGKYPCVSSSITNPLFKNIRC